MNKKTNTNNDYKRRAILTLSLSLSLSFNALAAQPGIAAKPQLGVAASSAADHALPVPSHTDSFSVNSPPGADSPSQMPANDDTSSAAKPITEWFQKFDAERSKHLPSSEERVIIARPINQQAERLTQWMAAAERIAKTYSSFAKMLRKMPIPLGYADLKDYKELTADWYEDTAQVFTDYIRPRPAARTIEELEDQVKEIKSREKSLAQTRNRIVEMDTSIRSKYKVDLRFPNIELSPNTTASK